MMSAPETTTRTVPAADAAPLPSGAAGSPLPAAGMLPQARRNAPPRKHLREGGFDILETALTWAFLTGLALAVLLVGMKRIEDNSYEQVQGRDTNAENRAERDYEIVSDLQKQPAPAPSPR